MAHGIFLLFLFFLGNGIGAKPIDFIRESFTVKSDRTWLWGWAWGAESTVSIVDRTPVLSFPSRPAVFGSELSNPLLGYVIPLSSFTQPCNVSTVGADIPPNLGCPKLCISGPQEPESSDTWIALVQRGSCEFVEKAREAQRLGAKAVIVGGNDPILSGNPDTLVNMYSPADASDVTIAATFIKYSDYMELSSLISTSNTSHSGLKTLSILITSESSAWEWYSPIITFVIILLLPSSLTFITLLIHRIRASRAALRERAPEDFVQSLPWRVWTVNGWEKHDGIPPRNPAESSNDDLEQGVAPDAVEAPSTSQAAEADEDPPWFDAQVECAICLSDFEIGDRVRVLPCRHIFHMDEVDGWLIQRKKLCPVCKADVTHPPVPRRDHAPNAAEEASNTTPTVHPQSIAPLATERTPLLRNDNNPDSGP
jgi:hypothetical protein